MALNGISDVIVGTPIGRDASGDTVCKEVVGSSHIGNDP